MKTNSALVNPLIFLLATLASAFSAAAAYADRTISFQITAQEPRPGFIQQAIVDFECKGMDGHVVTLPPGTGALTLTRSGNLFRGTYTVPNNLVDVQFFPYVRFVVDNSANPNVGWHTSNREGMRFADPLSPIYKDYSNTWSVEFREILVRARVNDGRDWVDAAPEVISRGFMPPANREVPAGRIRPDQFAQGHSTVILAFGEHFLDADRPLEVEGTLDVTMPDTDGNPVQTTLRVLQRVLSQAGGATEVRLDFNSFPWLEPIRRELEQSLQYVGIPDAGTISAVNVFTDPVETIAQWRQERLRRNVWYETTRIALGPRFDIREPTHGDTLLHEWMHETAYRTGWRSGGTRPDGTACPTGHSFGLLCPCEWMGWEEALGHFVGSHLLGRALAGVSGLRISSGANWMDTDGDVRRNVARGLLAECQQTRHRGNPGSWTEDVVAGALIELYRAEGFDTEKQPLNTLKAFVADWRGFAGQYGEADRTASNFFLAKRANVRSPVPVVDEHVVDQIALWYLITDPATLAGTAPIEGLVPLRLSGKTTRVNPAQKVDLTVSARAFHRLVGEYRGYAGTTLTVRLFESGSQIGNDAQLKSDATDKAYNFAATLSHSWPGTAGKTEEHHVHAEVWSNFPDGTTVVRVGRSDEVIVTVEGDQQTAPPPVAGKPTLKVQGEVVVTEIFPVSVDLPPTVAAQARYFSWGGAEVIQDKAEEPRNGAGQTPTTSAKMQFLPRAEFFPNGKPTALMKSVSVTVRDAQRNEIAWVSADILVKPAGFSGTATDIWEGDAGATGVNLKLKVQKGPAWKIPALCGSPAATASTSSSYGEIHANWDSREGFRYPEEIEAAIKTRMAKNGRVMPFSLGDFKGFIAVYDAAYVNGHIDCMTGFRDGVAMATGAGYVIKGHAVIRGEYRSNASGFSDNSERAWVEAQTKAIEAEGKGILAGLTISAVPNFVRTPYKGRPPDAAAPSLRLVLSPEKRKLRPGEEVALEAVIDNLRPDDGTPTFAWTGASGTGNAATYIATTLGKNMVAVTARLSTVTLGPVTAEFDVIRPTVSIARVSPPGPAVTIGGPVQLEARVMWAGAPLAGSFTLRWEPLEEHPFTPQESASLTTTVRFTKPGTTAVWVSVLEQRAGTLRTVAESDRLEIPVSAPEVQIGFSPASPYVGDEVRARASVPGLGAGTAVDFRWQLGTNGRTVSESQDSADLVFVPADARAVSVTVDARIAGSGEDIGTKTASITARPREVRVSVLGPGGAIAAGANVAMLASVSPEPRTAFRYVWMPTGCSIVGGGAGSEATFSRSDAGSCEVTVKVEDSRYGFELGRGSARFDVTISAADIRDAQMKTLIEEKTGEAERLIAAGSSAEAASVVTELSKIDQRAAIVIANELAAKAKQAAKEAEARRDFDTARELFGIPALVGVHDMEAARGVSNAPVYAERWRTVQRLVTEAAAFLDRTLVWSASKKIDEIRVYEGQLPPPVSALAQGVINRYESALMFYQVAVDDARKRYASFYAARQWDSAIAMLSTLKQRELFPEDLRWADKAISDAQDMRSRDVAIRPATIEPPAPPAVVTSGAGGGTPPRSGKKGYWRLVERKLGKTPSTHQCYPSEVLGGEGNLTVNTRSVCGEDGIVTVLVKWTPPPEILVPGEKLHIDSTLTPKVVRTARGIAVSLTAYIDYVAVGCGGVGPGFIRLTEYYAAGYGKAGGVGTGEAVVPGFGALGSKEAGRIQIKLCSESWHQYYIYQWIDDFVPEQTSRKEPPVVEKPASTAGTSASIADNYNGGGVRGDARCSLSFSLSRPHLITQIETYHWNSGHGARGGTIGLKRTDGTIHGPWPVKTYGGQGGAPDVYWRVTPGVVIPAGTYFVIDSDSATWSNNDQSNGCGFAKVEGGAAGE
ncbi:MAG: hypothetical protein HYX75_13400 [Acidobacteria bacterium]|nr:hypothetical protein [Acidobacteriota bacterium]